VYKKLLKLGNVALDDLALAAVGHESIIFPYGWRDGER